MLRRKTARRASGHVGRKKASARRSTTPSVRGLMLFARDGLWPVPEPTLWISVEDCPALAELHKDVIACLCEFQRWRKQGKRSSAVDDILTANYFRWIKEENKQVWLQVSAAASVCYQVLAQLQENERWRNVYRCCVCRRWFFARHDPRDATRPLCGPKCWPSKQPVRSTKLRRRVASTGSKTPR
jgi:hypothetical protein